MAKQKTTIYIEKLEDSYIKEFKYWCVERGYCGSTGKMKTISILQEIIKQSRKKSNSNIYKYGNRIVIREITAMYEIGTIFTRSAVQASLRGLEVNYPGMVSTSICFDLNSAVINDLEGLVNELTA